MYKFVGTRFQTSNIEAEMEMTLGQEMKCARCTCETKKNTKTCFKIIHVEINTTAYLTKCIKEKKNHLKNAGVFECKQ